MQTISNDSLETVTGGNGSIPGGSSTAGVSPAITPTPSAGTGGCQGGLYNSLQGINASLANLNKNNNGFNDTDMLMFGMAMMMSRPAASSVYVVNGGGYGYGHCGHRCW